MWESCGNAAVILWECCRNCVIGDVLESCRNFMVILRQFLGECFRNCVLVLFGFCENLVANLGVILWEHSRNSV